MINPRNRKCYKKKNGLKITSLKPKPIHLKPRDRKKNTTRNKKEKKKNIKKSIAILNNICYDYYSKGGL